MAGSGGIGSGGPARMPFAGDAPAASGRAPAGDYRAPFWLPGAHLQTIWSATVTPRPAVRYRREAWDAPDGDLVELDWAEAEPGVARTPARPLLVLFHGLEGSSQSPYARALMAEAVARGLDGVVVHFRGCGGTPNRLPRAYHSGDSDEADWVLRRLAARRGGDGGAQGALLAFGVSLGGNVLLKWLGERGRDAGFVSAAVAVSPPQDLHAGAIALSRGFNRLYAEHFLKTLRRKSLAMLERHPGLFDASRVAASRDFFDFDEWVTAPLHGFASAIDYWTRSSCRQFLGGIEVPTLVVNALNDPFLPASALAPPAQVSKAVRLEYPERGGHVGFVVGAPPGRHAWLPRRAFAHYADVLGADAVRPRTGTEG
ncbi:MAG: alpha/beta fold hydrolase [Burkholderiales bacterium]|jgi:predicted alpha/beta-fold hydrolase